MVIGILGVIIAQYAMLAILKGEFFPSNSPLGNPGQVSLLDTIMFQNNRNEYFWNESSSLRSSLSTSWLWLDPGLLIVGIASIFGNLYFFRHKQALHFGLWFASGYLFYLLRWQTLAFYIIPLIPVLVISVSVWVEALLGQARTRYAAIAVLAGVVFTSSVFMGRNPQTFRNEDTRGQRLAIEWARENVAPGEFVVIDNYAFLDLNPKEGQIEEFQYHYFWKVERDPEIRVEMLQNESENIDYLIMTPIMEQTLDTYDFPFLKEFVEDADKVAVLGDDYPVTVYRLAAAE